MSVHWKMIPRNVAFAVRLTPQKISPSAYLVPTFLAASLKDWLGPSWEGGANSHTSP